VVTHFCYVVPLCMVLIYDHLMLFGDYMIPWYVCGRGKRVIFGAGCLKVWIAVVVFGGRVCNSDVSYCDVFQMHVVSLWIKNLRCLKCMVI
jgi:hypothetical protein